jgi:hypothetical protein
VRTAVREIKEMMRFWVLVMVGIFMMD